MFKVCGIAPLHFCFAVKLFGMSCTMSFIAQVHFEIFLPNGYNSIRRHCLELIASHCVRLFSVQWECVQRRGEGSVTHNVGGCGGDDI